MKELRDEVEVWGLTGGIASGKSSAARFFHEAGIAVIDADRIARELASEGGAAHRAIVTRFGTADRALLRQLVFSDPGARQDLEDILHPLIHAESLHRMREIAKAASHRPVPVIYEAALLVEKERYKEFAGLIVIDAPVELRRERLIARDFIPAKLADQMIASQHSNAERLKAATIVISNSSSLDELRKNILEFIHARGW